MIRQTNIFKNYLKEIFSFKECFKMMSEFAGLVHAGRVSHLKIKIGSKEESEVAGFFVISQ